MDTQQYMALTDYAKENENGNDFSIFPGRDPWTMADHLYEIQKKHFARAMEKENFTNICNRNALCGIRSVLQRKNGDSVISVLDVFRAIRDNGYLNDDFLSQTFALTVNDVRRGLEMGIVPPSVKISLSLYFNIQ